MSDMRRVSLYLLGWYMTPIDWRLWRIPMKDADDPGPDDMEIFRPDVESMRAKASEHNELGDLRAAIEYHLGHDDEFLLAQFDVTLAELIQNESFRPEWALKRILAFVYRTLWPEAGPVEQAPDDVELVKVPLEEWRTLQVSRP